MCCVLKPIIIERQQQLNEIGRVEIALVPVDGSYTLDLDGMVRHRTTKAPLMIPMHHQRL